MLVYRRVSFRIHPAYVMRVARPLSRSCRRESESLVTLPAWRNWICRRMTLESRGWRRDSSTGLVMLVQSPQRIRKLSHWLNWVWLMFVFTSLTCLGLNKSGVIRVPTRDPSLNGLFVKGRVQIPWSDTNIARNYLLHMGILMKKTTKGRFRRFSRTCLVPGA